MIKIGIALVLILHGLVHLLYLGQSRRLFELQPGMIWPDGSWAFSPIFAAGTSRTLAVLFLALAALGFVAGGAAFLAGLSWWWPLLATTALFSSAIYILCWNGAWRCAQEQGAIGILINLVIITAVLLSN